MLMSNPFLLVFSVFFSVSLSQLFELNELRKFSYVSVLLQHLHLHKVTSSFTHALT